MKIILDASPLIHITKAGYEWIFNEFEVIIPRRVYEEVVETGKKIGAKDAFVIERLIMENTIKIEYISDRKFYRFVCDLASNKNLPLHQGEAEVLVLANEKNAAAVIDESVARNVGNVLGIKVRGTMYLFARLYKKNLIQKKEVIKALDYLVNSGWRISLSDYQKVKEALEKI